MTKQLAAQTTTPELVAAVDLGSNSFHLLVGRVEQTSQGLHVVPIDSLKESVRLASGLSLDKRLDAPSQARAVAALSRFGERLRAFHPQKVRVVATNTFRVAKNGADLLKTCEAALGFPIEIIAGKEEARLIYNGVAHTLAADGTKRLVVDIGGGSTEFIIGTDYEPALLESVFVGCIRFSRDYFPGGQITRAGFKQAIFEARREIQVIGSAFKSVGWDQAVGASGSAKALVEVLDQLGLSARQTITLEGLEQLRNLLIKRGEVDPAELPGIKNDRVPVFPGGLAIMTAIFEELELQEMHYSDGALRLGVLYDVLGRQRQDDMRYTTVEQFMARYGVDRVQAQHVGELAIDLWQQTNLGSAEEREEMSLVLGWVSCLLEIGFSISHNSHHKHSAYIVSQADMPGFSRRDQRLMSHLVLGHVGKLGKLGGLMQSDDQWAALACIRLASIFYRSRRQTKLPALTFSAKGKRFRLGLESKWLDGHPLTQYSLEQECTEWTKVGFDLQISEAT
jgi:exopolyphosphatase/guanosine-5'-triphosphate,3'-diphosphate pyrophosphatase